MMIEKRLKILARWLKDADVYIDSYHDGQLERAIKYSREETMHQIGDLLEEILNMNEKSVEEEYRGLENRDLYNNKGY